MVETIIQHFWVHGIILQLILWRRIISATFTTSTTLPHSLASHCQHTINGTVFRVHTPLVYFVDHLTRRAGTAFDAHSRAEYYRTGMTCTGTRWCTGGKRLSFNRAFLIDRFTLWATFSLRYDQPFTFITNRLQADDDRTVGNSCYALWTALLFWYLEHLTFLTNWQEAQDGRTVWNTDWAALSLWYFELLPFFTFWPKTGHSRTVWNTHWTTFSFWYLLLLSLFAFWQKTRHSRTVRCIAIIHTLRAALSFRCFNPLSRFAIGQCTQYSWTINNWNVCVEKQYKIVLQQHTVTINFCPI